VRSSKGEFGLTSFGRLLIDLGATRMERDAGYQEKYTK
jgi:hypothetical protein